MRDKWTGTSQQCAAFIDALRIALKKKPIKWTGKKIGERQPHWSESYDGVPTYGRSGGLAKHDAFEFVEPV